MQRKPEPELMDDAKEADAYAAADFSAVNQAFVDRLLELASSRSLARAVDLGAGPADIDIRLAKARPAWRIAAVDAAPAMLNIARPAIARAGLAGQIELVLADAKATGLSGGAFDVILSNSIVHHVTGIDLFWEEVRRLAAPGATVFIRDLARPGSEEQAREIVMQYAGGESAILQEEYYRSLLSAYTTDEVRGQLDKACLGMLEVKMITDRHWDVFGVVGPTIGRR